jgi:hypothetical protein
MQRLHALASVSIAILFACGCGEETPPPELVASAAESRIAPVPLEASEFGATLDRTSIRRLQFWIDDATFDAKWSSMLASPIDFFGGASSRFHAELAGIGRPLPGMQTLCHGDAKFDNFGWTLVEGRGVFSNNDFDDAGMCPVAADILRFLVATELWFSDPTLTAAALDTYVTTLEDPARAVAIDPNSEPDWSDTVTKGLKKDTAHDALVRGGEVQDATAAEIETVIAFAKTEPRVRGRVLDVARDVRTDGGSAGLRRFWLLLERADASRTIVELKELTTPGVDFGTHAFSLHGPLRLDLLKLEWWGSLDLGDHFVTHVLGADFIVRDRLTRTNPKPKHMSAAQIENMVCAEASALALRHRAAWGFIAPGAVRSWLAPSTEILVTRWQNAYARALAAK